MDECCVSPNNSSLAKLVLLIFSMDINGLLCHLNIPLARHSMLTTRNKQLLLWLNRWPLTKPFLLIFNCQYDLLKWSQWRKWKGQNWSEKPKKVLLHHWTIASNVPEFSKIYWKGVLFPPISLPFLFCFQLSSATFSVLLFPSNHSSPSWLGLAHFLRMATTAP